MKQPSRLPFAEVLATIFTDDEMKIANLFRLSDMIVTEQDAFWGRWAEASAEKQTQIIETLAEISEENFEVDFSPIFKKTLSSSHASVRKASLNGLWDSEDATLTPRIIQMMHEEETTDLRQTATATLAHYVMMASWGQIAKPIGDRVIEALVTVYKEIDVPDVIKNTALEALGASGHPEVEEFVADAYENGQTNAQKSALFAMGISGDDRWLSIVTDELESPYAEMRTEAARALGGIGISDSVSPLTNLIFDEDSEVQIAVFESLAKIGGAEAERVLEQLLENEELEPYHEYIEELQEEMDWMDGTFNLENFNLNDLEV